MLMQCQPVKNDWPTFREEFPYHTERTARQACKEVAVSISARCLTLAFTALLTACADPPEKIPTSYISPLEYQSFDCDQLSAELMRVTTKANELAGSIQQTASNDSTKMGVGLILFWPTLFFLSGNTPQASEFAQLKGRRDAIEQEAIAKKCTLPKVEPIAPPPAPVKQADKSPLYH